MLFEAAFWRPDVARPPLEQALASPELARYVEDFGRPGDLGLVAEEGAAPLGAAWWRYFEADAPGYGFVDEATPWFELTDAGESWLDSLGIDVVMLRVQRRGFALRCQDWSKRRPHVAGAVGAAS